jgi:long-chain acyl-CoA synthetase
MAEVRQYENPLARFYYWEKHHPAKVYLRQPKNGKWHEYTYADVGKKVRSVASWLRRHGVEPGDRVAILSKNCAEWIIADLAIMLAQAVSVPLYPGQQGETTEYILQHSASKVIFLGKLDPEHQTDIGLTPDIKRVGFPYPVDVDVDAGWDELMAEAPMTGQPLPDNSELATIIYTSGTTGFPKGVMHSFHSLAATGVNFSQELGFSEDDRFLSYLPLAHVAERGLLEMSSLYAGGQISFVESMDTFAENMQEVAPTAFFSVPRLYVKFQEKILEKIPQKKLDRLLSLPIVSGLIRRKLHQALGFHKIRRIGCGAAAVSPQLLEWYAKIGIVIEEGYGQTETMAYACTNRTGRDKFGTVGTPLPHCDVKISAEGEVLIKTDSMMTGYYMEPEKTAEVILDGYIRTGDLGSFDADGHLKITGRLKEIFKTDKGKFVAPQPIENKLWDTSLIDQLCVIGRGLPDPVALMVLSETAKKSSKDDLESRLQTMMAHTNKGLGNHEKVKRCIIVKEPWTVEHGLLTPTLKIKRHMVEERYRPLLEEHKAASQQVIWEEHVIRH